MVKRSEWGHGLATEAARAALSWAWEHVETDHIISVIHAANASSIRVAEKLGEQLERTETVDGVTTCTYGVHRTVGG